MNKIRIGLVCFLMLGICGTIGVAAQNKTDEMCIPLGSILLKPPDGVEQKRASVDFPHSGHFSYSCQTCHHKWEGEAPIVNCTTSDCHNLTKSPKKNVKSKDGADPAVGYYKTAFHDRCRGCHKEIKKKNKELEKLHSVSKPELMKTGPTACVACHPKQ